MVLISHLYLWICIDFSLFLLLLLFCFGFIHKNGNINQCTIEFTSNGDDVPYIILKHTYVRYLHTESRFIRWHTKSTFSIYQYQTVSQVFRFRYFAFHRFFVFPVTFALSIIIWFDLMGTMWHCAPCSTSSSSSSSSSCVFIFRVSMRVHCTGSTFSHTRHTYFHHNFFRFPFISKQQNVSICTQISNAPGKNTILPEDANTCLSIWSIWNRLLSVYVFVHN